MALFPDGSYVLPIGAIAGVTSRPAKAGDTISLYGVGFGPVTPNIPAGQTRAADQCAGIDAADVRRRNACHGGLRRAGAQFYWALPDSILVVPSVGNGAILTFTLGGTAGTQALNIAVQNWFMRGGNAFPSLQAFGFALPLPAGTFPRNAPQPFHLAAAARLLTAFAVRSFILCLRVSQYRTLRLETPRASASGVCQRLPKSFSPSARSSSAVIRLVSFYFGDSWPHR